MKGLSIRLALVVVILASTSGSFAIQPTPSASTNQSGPTLLKASLIVRANRLLHYWKAPEVDNYWSYRD